MTKETKEIAKAIIKSSKALGKSIKKAGKLQEDEYRDVYERVTKKSPNLKELILKTFGPPIPGNPLDNPEKKIITESL